MNSRLPAEGARLPRASADHRDSLDGVLGTFDDEIGDPHLVREVVIAGESWSAVDRAEELADAWRPVYVRHELSSASGGLLNVLATFGALAQVIARLSGHYDAGNWVTNAAADR
jgi:hypothetical protein